MQAIWTNDAQNAEVSHKVRDGAGPFARPGWRNNSPDE